MQAHMAASTVALASHGPFPFVNSPMAARARVGLRWGPCDVKLPLPLALQPLKSPWKRGWIIQPLLRHYYASLLCWVVFFLGV